MATVIDFEAAGMAAMRVRVAELGEANAGLIAYARGHCCAVVQVHAAVLTALEAESREHLIHIVTQDWVDILGVDVVALSFGAADATDALAPALPLLRAQSSVAVGSGATLTLGSRDAAHFCGHAGSEPLTFLAHAVERMLARWPTR
jgi:uncharacterized protein YigA (DUF484 family)